MRFLNSLVPSISVTYSNPFSIRLVASLMVLALKHCWRSSNDAHIYDSDKAAGETAFFLSSHRNFWYAIYGNWTRRILDMESWTA